MPLRCLLVSSDESLAPPIWEVLADLGIEGEYCHNAVEAVERVTTQLFQIVITDWNDQPEAEFLLKTARELKAAHRPLTLAIVKEDSQLQPALQAGANSILRKPLVPEQVRDTLGTAHDLLLAKQESSASLARQAAAPSAFSAAAAAAAAPAPAPIPTFSVTPPPAPTTAPPSVKQAPEKIRAGEFLQPSSSFKQIDTESDEAKSAVQAAVAEVDPLSELEPMAAAVEALPEAPREEEQPLGWVQVKERLARLRQQLPSSTPPPAAKPELLSYEDSAPPASVTHTATADPQSPAPGPHETHDEAQLFAYIAGESEEKAEPEVANLPNHLTRFLVVGALAAVTVIAFWKIPAAQQGIGRLFGSAAHAGGTWLNPQPVVAPQAPAQHETFGQAGDEYKLPTESNIPDATTDPSQIRVLPVVDPTVKPGNAAGPNGSTGQTTAAPSDASTTDPDKIGTPQATGQTDQNPSASPTLATEPTTGTPTVPPPSAVPNLSTVPEAPPQRTPQSSAQPRPVSVASNSSIPSSLKSQMASMTPEASGTKPVDAALPSIQPVDLPELAERSLLLQQIEPVYPETAKASRQQGNVVLQVLIAADGTVQDAKFLQGSLVFARSAIEAVRQWRFKPYQMNGRATSVQTVLTLNFRPPA